MAGGLLCFMIWGVNGDDHSKVWHSLIASDFLKSFEDGWGI